MGSRSRDRDMSADMSVTIDQGLEMYDAAEKRALKRLADEGLELRHEPPRTDGNKFYDGRVPANLGSQTPAIIGEYYGLQTQYVDYVSGLTVLARAEMLSANEKLDLVKASVRKSKMGTAQEKEDLARIDARYVELNAEYMEAKTFFELMTTLEEAARRDVKFISRIVETKKLELEMGGRGGSLGRPGAGGPNRFSRPRERDR